MKKFKYAYIAVPILLLTACQQQEEQEQVAKDKVEIRFSTAIEGTTRTTQNTKFDPGEEISITISDPSGTTTYEPRKYTCLADGKLQPEDDTQRQYYPATEYGYIYVHASYPASYPPKSGVPDHLARSGDIFMISDNQSTLLNADGETIGNEALYKSHDLMYGTYYGSDGPQWVARQTEDTEIPLTFKHLMCKITVKVTADEAHGTTDADLVTATAGCTIQLLNVLRTMELSYDDGVGGIAKSGIAGESTTDITLATATQKKKVGMAMIPPQTINGSFISVKLGNNAPCDPFVVNTKFEGGKAYTYDIKVGAQSISVSTKITDWTAGGTVSGSIAVNN